MSLRKSGTPDLRGAPRNDEIILATRFCCARGLPTTTPRNEALFSTCLRHRMIPKSGVRFSDRIMRTKREAKRRKAHPSTWPRHTLRHCRLKVLRARQRALTRPARLPALHRGACRSERTPDSAQAVLHATKRLPALPAASIALKQGTLRAGRNAGGIDARTARGRASVRVAK